MRDTALSDTLKFSRWLKMISLDDDNKGSSLIPVCVFALLSMDKLFLRNCCKDFSET